MGPFETERLTMRQFEAGDWPTIYQLVYNDRDVYRMYSSLGGRKHAAQQRFEHVANQPSHAEFGRLAVVRRADGVLIGQVHLDPHVTGKREIADEVPSRFSTIDVELAFAFGKAYWGQGYAYEACHRMVVYAFEQLELPRLVGGVMEQNERSIALHRRLGYRFVRNPNAQDPVGLIAILDNDGVLR